MDGLRNQSSRLGPRRYVKGSPLRSVERLSDDLDRAYSAIDALSDRVDVLSETVLETARIMEMMVDVESNNHQNIAELTQTVRQMVEMMRRPGHFATPWR